MGWLRHSSQGVQKQRTSRASSHSAHPFQGGPLVTDSRHPSASSAHRCAKPHGTTSALAGGGQSGSSHHVPTSLRSTVVTRFCATTDALTPTGPFVAAGRGSLIHVPLTSDPAVSNHLRFSAGRVPLPQRRQHYFVRASPFRSQARQNRRPNRVHVVAVRPPRRYGRVVLLPMLSTRGYGPDAVSFGYWPCSVGQVRDFHPAVKERSQAHEHTPPACGLRRRAANRVAPHHALNPNSEVAAVISVGSTGHWPVPSGDPPLGTPAALALFAARFFRVQVLAVPSGQWPDGTGGSPVLPIPTSEFGLNGPGLRTSEPWKRVASP